MKLNTGSKEYASYFCKAQNIWWKRLLPVQIPYRYNIKRLCKGKTLEIGCGTGRNLFALKGRAVGVDHNEIFVNEACKKGFKVYLPEVFIKTEFAVSSFFDTLLFSHILEHLTFIETEKILVEYAKYLKNGGRIILILPQLAGFKADCSHKTYFDIKLVNKLCSKLGWRIKKFFYFPFRCGSFIGDFFRYNELNVVIKIG